VAAWVVVTGGAVMAGALASDLVDELATGGDSKLEALVLLLAYPVALAGLVSIGAVARWGAKG
jgi:predicted alpha/beta-hydrolase family hydrolase